AASVAALRAHAADCAVCAGKLALWDAIDAEAPALRRDWESPGLMRKIAAALEVEEEKARRPRPLESERPRPRGRFQWVPLAAAAALFVISMVGLQVFQAGRGR